MIEVVHYKNRFGKDFVGVLEYDKTIAVHTPAGKQYAMRYAAGLEKPFYPVPVVYDSTIHEDGLTRIWAIVMRIFLHD